MYVSSSDWYAADDPNGQLSTTGLYFVGGADMVASETCAVATIAVLNPDTLKVLLIEFFDVW